MPRATRLPDPYPFRFIIHPGPSAIRSLGLRQSYRGPGNLTSDNLLILAPDLGAFTVKNPARLVGRLHDCYLRKEDGQYIVTGYAYATRKRPVRKRKAPPTPVPSLHLCRNGRHWPNSRK